MADNNVYIKCSDGFQNNLNSKKTKMDTSFINQSEKDMSGQPVDRLKLLYPNVDEKLTPLPRSWSSQEKCISIGLTQNNLRVHYKGFYTYFKLWLYIYI